MLETLRSKVFFRKQVTEDQLRVMHESCRRLFGEGYRPLLSCLGEETRNGFPYLLRIIQDL